MKREARAAVVCALLTSSLLLPSWSAKVGAALPVAKTDNGCPAETNGCTRPLSFSTCSDFFNHGRPAFVLEGRTRHTIELSGEGLAVWRSGLADDPVAGAKRIAFLEQTFYPVLGQILTVTVDPAADDPASSDVTLTCDGTTIGFRAEGLGDGFGAKMLARSDVKVHYLTAARDPDAVASIEYPHARRHFRINQLGYACRAPKVAELTAPLAEKYGSFRVERVGTNLAWTTVYEAKFPPARDGFALADFSSVTEPGDYRIVCGKPSSYVGNQWDRRGACTSAFFQIRDGVYDPLQRGLFDFFTWQRCGSKKGWAGVCHQKPAPLVGTDRTIDVRGGHHQSCDLRHWADDSARAIWHLYRWAEVEHPLWDDGIVDEELRWGTDYYVRLIGPEGWAYDCQNEPIGWGPCNYYLDPAPMNAQICVLHVLASAAKRFKAKDAAFAATCAAKAETLMRSLETNPVFAKPYRAACRKLPPGSQPESWYANSVRGNPNGDAAFASCAVELFEATGNAVYREKALAYGERVLKTFDRIKYSKSVGTGSIMALAPARLLALTGDARYRELLRRQCEKAVGYVDSLRAKGSVGGVELNALVLLGGYRAFGDARYHAAAQRCLDWCLGVNCREVSVVNGFGRNQQPLEVFGQFFPSTPWIPGGTTHVIYGEYNLPNASMLMEIAHALSRSGLPGLGRHLFQRHEAAAAADLPRRRAELRAAAREGAVRRARTDDRGVLFQPHPNVPRNPSLARNPRIAHNALLPADSTLTLPCLTAVPSTR